MMRQKAATAFVTLMFAALIAGPARAADRETMQMMADIRMLQEQTQQLQILLGTLGEAIQTLTGRIDEQSGATTKAFADQKLGVDALSNDVRVVREKVDDNNVRVGSLGQELGALRRSVLQLSVTVASLPAPVATDGAEPLESTDTMAPFTAALPPPPAELPPPVAIGASPQRMWDLAYADYTAGQYDLAVLSYEGFIRSFPTDDRVDDAQVGIASAYLQAGDNDKAIEAADLAIRNYPNGDALPEAFYRKGLALKNVQQTEAAREAFEHIVATYPNSDVSILAQQAILSLDEGLKP
jgi:TolA-binding protein